MEKKSRQGFKDQGKKQEETFQTPGWRWGVEK